jgi:hypothetical protein
VSILCPIQGLEKGTFPQPLKPFARTNKFVHGTHIYGRTFLSYLYIVVQAN